MRRVTVMATMLVFAFWACGDEVTEPGPTAGATMLHYDGTTWNEVPIAIEEFLIGIWGSASNDVFAVGTSATILHYDGATWSTMSAGPDAQLLSGEAAHLPQDVLASRFSPHTLVQLSGQWGRDFFFW